MTATVHETFTARSGGGVLRLIIGLVFGLVVTLFLVGTAVVLVQLGRLLAHLLGEQRFAQAVVDLVSARVVEILSLEIDLRTAEGFTWFRKTMSKPTMSNNGASAPASDNVFVPPSTSKT